jgi:GNAT superfamily N-acetyltransferase
MELIARPFAGEADLPLIDDLAQAASPKTRHLVDLPWRVSSPAVETGQDMRLWTTVDGTAVGFSAWQQWWAVLDVIVRPGPFQHDVEADIFAWVPTRFRELDAQRGHPLPYWVEARDDDAERLDLLARRGYDLEDDLAYQMLGRPLAEPIPPSDTPSGYAIGPLADYGDVEQYVAVHRRAFASTSMTVAWRMRTLKHPRYRPDLDLVAVTPDGQLAGFCVGWLDADRHLAQIEPVGVDPAHQGRGMGRALMLEMLHRFKASGADQALVETETTRLPARAAYESVGFRPIHRAIRKGRWFVEGHDDPHS